MIKREFRALIYTSALFVKSVSIKIQFFLKKGIANFKSIVYTSRCCDMIAMKREVAADKAGFPWSECQVKETGDKSLYPQLSPPVRVETTVCKHQDTHG